MRKPRNANQHTCAACNFPRLNSRLELIKGRYYCTDKTCAYDAARHHGLPPDACISLAKNVHVLQAQHQGWKITLQQMRGFDAEDRMYLDRRVRVTYGLAPDKRIWATVTAWILHPQSGAPLAMPSDRAQQVKTEIFGPDAGAQVFLPPDYAAETTRGKTILLHCLDAPVDIPPPLVSEMKGAASNAQNK